MCAHQRPLCQNESYRGKAFDVWSLNITVTQRKTKSLLCKQSESNTNGMVCAQWVVQSLTIRKRLSNTSGPWENIGRATVLECRSQCFMSHPAPKNVCIQIQMCIGVMKIVLNNSHACKEL